VQINSNISQLYLEKVAKRGKNRQLDKIAREFLEETLSYPGKINLRELRIGLPEERDFRVINKMTCLAYGWRYGDQEKGAKVVADFMGEDTDKMTTVVAKVRKGERELILATCRLVRDDLELFKFFNFKDGRTWADYLGGRCAYEVERLAFHPLFEMGDYRVIQFQLLKEFYPVVQSLISEKNAWLGCTLRDNVKRFVEMAGMKVTAIPGLEFASNDYVDLHMQINPNYFKDFYAYIIE
jgi:hypothetical protein